MMNIACKCSEFKIYRTFSCYIYKSNLQLLSTYNMHRYLEVYRDLHQVKERTISCFESSCASRISIVVLSIFWHPAWYKLLPILIGIGTSFTSASICLIFGTTFGAHTSILCIVVHPSVQYSSLNCLSFGTMPHTYSFFSSNLLVHPSWLQALSLKTFTLAPCLIQTPPFCTYWYILHVCKSWL